MSRFTELLEKRKNLEANVLEEEIMNEELNQPSCLGGVIPSFLHPSTVVKVEHVGELAYVIVWCDFKKINVAQWQRDINKFPIALSLNQATLGWTDEFDRALYYISFDDWLRQANWV